MGGKGGDVQDKDNLCWCGKVKLPLTEGKLEGDEEGRFYLSY